MWRTHLLLLFLTALFIVHAAPSLRPQLWERLVYTGSYGVESRIHSTMHDAQTQTTEPQTQAGRLDLKIELDTIAALEGGAWAYRVHVRLLRARLRDEQPELGATNKVMERSVDVVYNASGAIDVFICDTGGAPSSSEPADTHVIDFKRLVGALFHFDARVLDEAADGEAWMARVEEDMNGLGTSRYHVDRSERGVTTLQRRREWREHDALREAWDDAGSDRDWHADASFTLDSARGLVTHMTETQRFTVNELTPLWTRDFPRSHDVPAPVVTTATTVDMRLERVTVAPAEVRANGVQALAHAKDGRRALQSTSTPGAMRLSERHPPLPATPERTAAFDQLLDRLAEAFNTAVHSPAQHAQEMNNTREVLRYMRDHHTWAPRRLFERYLVESPTAEDTDKLLVQRMAALLASSLTAEAQELLVSCTHVTCSRHLTPLELMRALSHIPRPSAATTAAVKHFVETSIDTGACGTEILVDYGTLLLAARRRHVHLVGTLALDLGKMLHAHSNTESTIHILAAIGNCGHEVTNHIVEEYLDHPHANIRATAVFSLRKFQHGSAHAHLHNVLRGGDSEVVRRAAAHAFHYRPTTDEDHTHFSAHHRRETSASMRETLVQLLSVKGISTANSPTSRDVEHEPFPSSNQTMRTLNALPALSSYLKPQSVEKRLGWGWSKTFGGGIAGAELGASLEVLGHLDMDTAQGVNFHASAVGDIGAYAWAFGSGRLTLLHALVEFEAEFGWKLGRDAPSTTTSAVDHSNISPRRVSTRAATSTVVCDASLPYYPDNPPPCALEQFVLDLRNIESSAKSMGFHCDPSNILTLGSGVSCKYNLEGIHCAGRAVEGAYDCEGGLMQIRKNGGAPVPVDTSGIRLLKNVVRGNPPQAADPSAALLDPETDKGMVRWVLTEILTKRGLFTYLGGLDHVLTVGQVRAMVSLVYNAGGGAISASSKLGKAIAQYRRPYDDPESIYDVWTSQYITQKGPDSKTNAPVVKKKRSRASAGIIRRRIWEAKLFTASIDCTIPGMETTDQCKYETYTCTGGGKTLLPAELDLNTLTCSFYERCFSVDVNKQDPAAGVSPVVLWGQVMCAANSYALSRFDADRRGATWLKNLHHCIQDGFFQRMKNGFKGSRCINSQLQDELLAKTNPTCARAWLNETYDRCLHDPHYGDVLMTPMELCEVSPRDLVVFVMGVDIANAKETVAPWWYNFILELYRRGPNCLAANMVAMCVDNVRRADASLATWPSGAWSSDTSGVPRRRWEGCMNAAFECANDLEIQLADGLKKALALILWNRPVTDVTLPQSCLTSGITGRRLLSDVGDVLNDLKVKEYKVHRAVQIAIACVEANVFTPLCDDEKIALALLAHQFGCAAFRNLELLNNLIDDFSRVPALLESLKASLAAADSYITSAIDIAASKFKASMNLRQTSEIRRNRVLLVLGGQTIIDQLLIPDLPTTQRRLLGLGDGYSFEKLLDKRRFQLFPPLDQYIPVYGPLILHLHAEGYAYAEVKAVFAIDIKGRALSTSLLPHAWLSLSASASLELLVIRGGLELQADVLDTALVPSETVSFGQWPLSACTRVELQSAPLKVRLIGFVQLRNKLKCGLIGKVILACWFEWGTTFQVTIFRWEAPSTMRSLYNTCGQQRIPSYPRAGSISLDSLDLHAISLGSISDLAVHWDPFTSSGGRIGDYKIGLGSSFSFPDISGLHSISLPSFGLPSFSSFGLPSFSIPSGTQLFLHVRGRLAETGDTVVETTKLSLPSIFDISPPDFGFLNDGVDELQQYFQASLSSLSVSFSITDLETSVSGCKLSVGEAPACNSISDGFQVSYQRSLISRSPLQHGKTYCWQVQCADKTGFISQMVTNGITVDTTPPIPGVVFIVNTTDQVAIPQGGSFFVSSSAVTLSWANFSDPESGMQRYQVTCALYPLANRLAIPVGDVGVAYEPAVLGTTQLPVEVVSGTLVYCGVDGFNNALTFARVDFSPIILDLVPPAAYWVTDGNVTAVDFSYTRFQQRLICATWSLYDTESGIQSIMWRGEKQSNAGAFVSITKWLPQPVRSGSAASVGGACTPIDPSATDVWYRVAVQVVDRVGHAVTLYTDGWVYDTVAPKIWNASIGLFLGRHSQYIRTAMYAPVTHYATDRYGVARYEACITPNNRSCVTGDWVSHDSSLFGFVTGLNLSSDVQYYAIVRAYDLAGNMANTTTLPFTCDPIPPVAGTIKIVASLKPLASKHESYQISPFSFNVSWANFTDNVGLDECIVYAGDEMWASNLAKQVILPWRNTTLLLTPYNPVPPGVRVFVTVTCYDLAGWPAKASSASTTIDFSPPYAGTIKDGIENYDVDVVGNVSSLSFTWSRATNRVLANTTAPIHPPFHTVVRPMRLEIEPLPTDEIDYASCDDIFKRDPEHAVDGVYTIYPQGFGAPGFEVVCMFSGWPGTGRAVLGLLVNQDRAIWSATDFGRSRATCPPLSIDTTVIPPVVTPALRDCKTAAYDHLAFFDLQFAIAGCDSRAVFTSGGCTLNTTAASFLGAAAAFTTPGRAWKTCVVENDGRVALIFDDGIHGDNTIATNSSLSFGRVSGDGKTVGVASAAPVDSPLAVMGVGYIRLSGTPAPEIDAGTPSDCENFGPGGCKFAFPETVYLLGGMLRPQPMWPPTTTPDGLFGGFIEDESELSFRIRMTLEDGSVVVPWADIGRNTSHTFTDLALEPGLRYITCVEATNSVAMRAVACTNGVIVDYNVTNTFGITVVTGNNGIAPYAQANLTHVVAQWRPFESAVGVLDYELSLGRQAGYADLLAWARVPAAALNRTANLYSLTTRFNATMKSGDEYYVGLRGRTTTGQWTTIYSARVVLDTTPPDVFEVSDIDSGYTFWSESTAGATVVHATWSPAIDGETGVLYNVSFVDATTGSNLATVTTTTLSAQFAVILTRGHTYRTVVTATNVVRLSRTSTSTGFTVEWLLPRAGTVGLVNSINGTATASIISGVEYIASRDSVNVTWTNFTVNLAPIIRYMVRLWRVDPLTRARVDVASMSVDGSFSNVVFTGLNHTDGAQGGVIVSAISAADALATDVDLSFTVDTGEHNAAGTVIDGSTGAQTSTQASLTQCALITPFSSPFSPILFYDVSFVDANGLIAYSTVLPRVNTTARICNRISSMTPGLRYFTAVAARTAAGHVISAVSEGVIADITPPIPNGIPVLNCAGSNGSTAYIGSLSSICVAWLPPIEEETSIVDVAACVGIPSDGGACSVARYQSFGPVTHVVLTDLELSQLGSYYVRVRWKNEANLTAEAPSAAALVDITPPLAVHLEVLPSPDAPFIDRSSAYVTNSTVCFYFEVPIDAESGIVTQLFRLINADIGSIVSYGDIVPSLRRNDSCIADTTLVDGSSYFLRWIVTNGAGLQTQVDSSQFLYDSTSPTIGNTTNNEANALVHVPYWNRSDEACVSWRGLDDRESGLESVEVVLYVNDEVTVSVTWASDAAAVGTPFLCNPVNLTTGDECVWRLKARNRAGLTSITNTLPFVVDVSSPVIAAVHGMTTQSLGPRRTLQTTRGAALSLTIAAASLQTGDLVASISITEGVAPLTSFRVGVGSSAGGTEVMNATERVVPTTAEPMAWTSGLPSGDYFLTVCVTTAAGASLCESSTQITLDQDPPSPLQLTLFSCTPPPNNTIHARRNDSGLLDVCFNADAADVGTGLARLGMQLFPCKHRGSSPDPYSTAPCGNIWTADWRYESVNGPLPLLMQFRHNRTLYQGFWYQMCGMAVDGVNLTSPVTCSPPIVFDQTPPVAGSVVHGVNTTGNATSEQGYTEAIVLRWDGFSDGESYGAMYQVNHFTNRRVLNDSQWSTVALDTNFTIITGLNLTDGETVYGVVCLENNAGARACATSTGSFVNTSRDDLKIYDLSPPVCSEAFDTVDMTVPPFYTPNNSSLALSFHCEDPETGIGFCEVCVSSIGANTSCDVLPWSFVGTVMSLSERGNLTNGVHYYKNVTCCSNVNQCTSFASRGQLVDVTPPEPVTILVGGQAIAGFDSPFFSASEQTAYVADGARIPVRLSEARDMESGVAAARLCVSTDGLMCDGNPLELSLPVNGGSLVYLTAPDIAARCYVLGTFVSGAGLASTSLSLPFVIDSAIPVIDIVHVSSCDVCPRGPLASSGQYVTSDVSGFDVDITGSLETAVGYTLTLTYALREVILTTTTPRARLDYSGAIYNGMIWKVSVTAIGRNMEASVPFVFTVLIDTTPPEPSTAPVRLGFPTHDAPTTVSCQFSSFIESESELVVHLVTLRRNGKDVESMVLSATSPTYSVSWVIGIITLGDAITCLVSANNTAGLVSTNISSSTWLTGGVEAVTVVDRDTVLCLPLNAYASATRGEFSLLTITLPSGALPKGSHVTLRLLNVSAADDSLLDFILYASNATRLLLPGTAVLTHDPAATTNLDLLPQFYFSYATARRDGESSLLSDGVVSLSISDLDTIRVRVRYDYISAIIGVMIALFIILGITAACILYCKRRRAAVEPTPPVPESNSIVETPKPTAEELTERCRVVCAEATAIVEAQIAARLAEVLKDRALLEIIHRASTQWLAEFEDLVNHERGFIPGEITVLPDHPKEVGNALRARLHRALANYHLTDVLRGEVKTYVVVQVAEFPDRLREEIARHMTEELMAFGPSAGIRDAAVEAITAKLSNLIDEFMRDTGANSLVEGEFAVARSTIRAHVRAGTSDVLRGARVPPRQTRPRFIDPPGDTRPYPETAAPALLPPLPRSYVRPSAATSSPSRVALAPPLPRPPTIKPASKRAAFPPLPSSSSLSRLNAKRPAALSVRQSSGRRTGRAAWAEGQPEDIDDGISSDDGELEEPLPVTPLPVVTPSSAELAGHAFPPV